MRRLRQDQWDWIFDYAFTLLVGIVYASVIHWFEACLDGSWLMAAVLVHQEAFVWKRRFPR